MSLIRLMRLDKPIGIALLLWPTLWALWLASDRKPDLKIVIIFVLGVIIMRSAGCIVNDLADRKFDGLVERTRHRPLVSGEVSVKAAKILLGFLLVAAFSLVLMLNTLTIKLAFIGAALAFIYPFLKRVTYLPQLGLGLAFAWGVPMAFAAIQNTVPEKAWFLFAAAVVWPMIYDTFYAMVDRDDDIKIGVKSTAILCGRADKLFIGIMQFIFLILIAYVGLMFNLHKAFSYSLWVVLILFIHQQYITRDRDKTACFKAFLNNHWVGAAIFFGIGVAS